MCTNVYEIAISINCMIYLTYRSTATRIKQEVGCVGSNRRLIRDWAMSKCHAHNGSHVSLCAEHVDGNPSGLSYKHI